MIKFFIFFGILSSIYGFVRMILNRIGDAANTARRKEVDAKIAKDNQTVTDALTKSSGSVKTYEETVRDYKRDHPDGK